MCVHVVECKVRYMFHNSYICLLLSMFFSICFSPIWPYPSLCYIEMIFVKWRSLVVVIRVFHNCLDLLFYFTCLQIELCTSI